MSEATPPGRQRRWDFNPMALAPGSSWHPRHPPLEPLVWDGGAPLPPSWEGSRGRGGFQGPLPPVVLPARLCHPLPDGQPADWGADPAGQHRNSSNPGCGANIPNSSGNTNSGFTAQRTRHPRLGARERAGFTAQPRDRKTPQEPGERAVDSGSTAGPRPRPRRVCGRGGAAGFLALFSRGCYVRATKSTLVLETRPGTPRRPRGGLCLGHGRGPFPPGPSPSALRLPPSVL